MKSLMKCCIPAHFSLSHLVKYFVRLSSLISLVDFMYGRGESSTLLSSYAVIFSGKYVVQCIILREPFSHVKLECKLMVQQVPLPKW